MAALALRIDPEFQKIIPPLTDEEYGQLRENILADGEVYEPIVVWEVTIIDGHNRWKIVQEHPEIPYHIRKMEFFDKWAAFDWMYKKQLGRRNLNDEQRTVLIGRMYKNRKLSPGGDRRSEEFSSCQNGNLKTGRSAEAVGSEIGVSARTVSRAEKYVDGIDAIRDVSDEAAARILRGGSGVNKNTVMAFPGMEHDEQVKVTEAIVSGTFHDNAGKKNEKETPVPSEPAPDGGEPKPKEPEADPGTVWDPVRHRRIDPMIERINAEGRDPNRVREYTLDDMIAEMRSISENHTSQLHRVLIIRSTLLNNAEARNAVFAFITESVAALEELRQFVQPGMA